MHRFAFEIGKCLPWNVAPSFVYVKGQFPPSRTFPSIKTISALRTGRFHSTFTWITYVSIAKDLQVFTVLRQLDLTFWKTFFRPELSKPAKNLYSHTLTAILESAVRVTNAQFEDEEILKRLTVGLLHQCTGDTGWDIFSLIYIVDGPVGTILRPAMTEYQTLFGSLWKAKRMEYVLSNMRKQQISCNKMFRDMKGKGLSFCTVIGKNKSQFLCAELLPTMHLIQVLSSEMIHFLHQTQYYFLFEVLECSWAEMMRQVNQAECLDDVINAHNTFLSSVQCGVLLDSGSENINPGSTVSNPCLRAEPIRLVASHLLRAY